MAQILPPTPQNIEKVVSALSEGLVVGIPTETVYGLAGNALDQNAIGRIYSVKGRPSNNPLIVHVGNWDQLAEIAEISPKAKILGDKFWPGPLSLILRKTESVPSSVTAGSNTIAVRMPAHPVFLKLAEQCPFPIAAPSANPSGYISPTCAQHVKQGLGDKIEFILDGETSDAGIESTIVSLVNEESPTLLRLGVITKEQIESALGEPISYEQHLETGDKSLSSPGLFSKHYSPNTPLILFSGEAPPMCDNEALVLLTSTDSPRENIFHLSEDGQVETIARNLYRVLHELDQRGLNKIHMELPTGEGIALALIDRMTRAASQA